VSALCCVTAILTALRHREVAGGAGQVVDLAIIEPLLTLLGAQSTVYDQLGELPVRTGNRSANNAPRNVYRTLDRRWVAISTSSQSIAERVMRLVGHPEVVDQPWFGTGAGRAAHADELDGYVSAWIAQRPLHEVVDEFETAQAAVAPVYDVRDIFADPQYQALDSITTVPDEDLGPIRMPNVLYRLSGTPGSIRWTGRAHGADTEQVLRERLGLGPDEVARLRSVGAA